jgi:CheY-like chemotaxis protein
LDAVHMVCELLSSLGHLSEYAVNGYVALQVARGFKPDFVFVDIGLPGVDGFDVCRQLRRDSALRNVEVAILSAYDGNAFRDLARRAGCTHYFVKPVSLAQLTQLFGDATTPKSS